MIVYRPHVIDRADRISTPDLLITACLVSGPAGDTQVEHIVVGTCTLPGPARAAIALVGSSGGALAAPAWLSPDGSVAVIGRDAIRADRLPPDETRPSPAAETIVLLPLPACDEAVLTIGRGEHAVGLRRPAR